MTTSYKLYGKNWRKKNPDKWNACKKRNYKKGSKNKQHHREEWTMREDARITDPNRPKDRVLAEELGRTVLAIQLRRCRLNKV